METMKRSIERSLNENMSLHEIISGKLYELMPNDSHKSFYGKAVILVMPDGTQTLFSYGTRIVTRMPNGDLVGHWFGWSATTGRHIKAFCGLNKAEYFKIPSKYEYEKKQAAGAAD